MYACFAEYRQEQKIDRFTAKLWIDKAEEFCAAWHAANDKKPAKRGVRQTDDDWIEELQADPANAGVDVRRELGRAQFWARENRRQCNRKFFTNWLLKAERTVDASITPVRKFVAIPAEPSGWLAWMRVNRPDWRRFKEADEGHPIPSWAGLGPEERNYILTQAK